LTIFFFNKVDKQLYQLPQIMFQVHNALNKNKQTNSLWASGLTPDTNPDFILIFIRVRKKGEGER